ncbi:MAG: flagellar biosynthesis protein FlhB [Clostridia bacterium]|nr:flagellar biosynthesis protein FlhB [Clostridia bacterium]
MADSSKTEKATPKKRRDERKKGNVFMSRDAVSVASLLGAYFAFTLFIGALADGCTRFMRYCIGSTVGQIGTVSTQLGEIGIQALRLLATTVLPMTLLTILCAVVATFYQTRMLVAGELLRPKFSRLNPLQGFKRLFSLKSLVEVLKNILKITVLIYIIYRCLEGMLLESSRYLYADLAASMGHLYDEGKSMVLWIILAFLVLAGADYLYQYWEYEREMRMSKQEIKEEYKQMEGDPKVKGKIKQIQRQRSRSRMIQKVPEADVIVRNPTHVAVALRYKPEVDAAPVVLAMGVDEFALRIVAVGEQHGVAVVENVPLARQLLAEAEVDREIPPNLYNAVAEVMVYLYQIDGQNRIAKV